MEPPQPAPTAPPAGDDPMGAPPPTPAPEVPRLGISRPDDYVAPRVGPAYNVELPDAPGGDPPRRLEMTPLSLRDATGHAATTELYAEVRPGTPRPPRRGSGRAARARAPDSGPPSPEERSPRPARLDARTAAPARCPPGRPPDIGVADRGAPRRAAGSGDRPRGGRKWRVSAASAAGSCAAHGARATPGAPAPVRVSPLLRGRPGPPRAAPGLGPPTARGRR